MKYLINIYSIFLLLSSCLYAENIEQKIGKLIVIPLSPDLGESHVEKVIHLLKHKGIGGVILIKGHAEDAERILCRIRSEVPQSVICLQDAEWGIGMRMVNIPSLPKNLTLGAIQNLEMLTAYGREIATECREVGIQGGLAPVVDVNSNPLNPVIHMRSFGDNPEEVYKRASAVIKGMNEGGLWTCLKHFPGHGDTVIDSHKGLPIITKSIEELNQGEFYPFKKLIEEGVDMVLVGHLLFPALDPEWPASLSEKIVEELLRKNWGFQGVVITDALNMRALIDNYPFETIIVRAFQSGADLLLSAAADQKAIETILDYGVDIAMNALKNAFVKGEIKEEEIDLKLQRIQALKEKKIPSILKKRTDLKKHLFQHAITHIGKVSKTFPVGGEVALVQDSPDPIFLEKLEKYARVHCFSFAEMIHAEKYSSMIVQVMKGHIPIYIPHHATIALFDSPYELKNLSENLSIFVGYENQEEAKDALVEVLFGKIPPLGKLPVHISKK